MSPSQQNKKNAGGKSAPTTPVNRPNTTTTTTTTNVPAPASAPVGGNLPRSARPDNVIELSSDDDEEESPYVRRGQKRMRYDSDSDSEVEEVKREPGSRVQVQGGLPADREELIQELAGLVERYAVERGLSGAGVEAARRDLINGPSLRIVRNMERQMRIWFTASEEADRRVALIRRGKSVGTFAPKRRSAKERAAVEKRHVEATKKLFGTSTSGAIAWKEDMKRLGGPRGPRDPPPPPAGEV